MTNTATVVSSASVEIDPQKLRELRQDLGLLQGELGKRAGLSAGYISQLEIGARTRVSPPVFAKLCDALKIPQKRRWTLRKSSTIRQAA
jgi:transcriptional regulator with XRE-family HTH domain